MAAPGYWVITDENLEAMLHRVADGEDVGLVLAEEYANSAHEEVPGAEEG